MLAGVFFGCLIVAVILLAMATMFGGVMSPAAAAASGLSPQVAAMRARRLALRRMLLLCFALVFGAVGAAGLVYINVAG